MANVPTVEAPTQSINGGPIRVNAPAEAFGADVLGKALSAFGGTEQQQSNLLAQRAEQFQSINNKAAADKGFYTNIQQSNQWVEDFKSNHLQEIAQDPVGAVAKAGKELETLRTNIGESMTNPLARAQYDADTRRNFASLMVNLSGFAHTTNKNYVLKQAAGVQDALSSDTALHPENFTPNLNKMLEQQAFINQQLGLSKAEGDNEARVLIGKTVQDVSLGIADKGDVAGAAKFLEDHKEMMEGHLYQQTLSRLRPGIMANDAAQWGQQAVEDATSNLTGNASVEPQGYLAAVHGREGSGTNPRSSAKGTGQFLEGTWLQIMKSPEFAQATSGLSRQQILNLRSNANLANQAILVYGQQNAAALQSAGFVPTPSNVGLAHGFGSGGAVDLLRADPSASASSVLPSAVIRANPELAHQTVGQILSGFGRRFGGVQSVDAATGGAPTSADLQGRMEAALTAADQYAEARYPGNAVMKNQFEQSAQATLNRRIAAARDTENNSFMGLGAAILDNHIEDPAALYAAIPGAASAINTLRPDQRTTLNGYMRSNANEITPARADNIGVLSGMYATANLNPTPFLNADISTMDLPAKVQQQWLARQQKFRAGQELEAQSDKTITHAVHSREFNSSLDSLGVKPYSDQYYHFVGALQSEIADYEATHNNAPPKDNELPSLIARVTAQSGTKYSFWDFQHQHPKPDGSPAYEPTPSDIEKATAAFHQLYGATAVPNSQDLGRIAYAMNARRRANAP